MQINIKQVITGHPDSLQNSKRLRAVLVDLFPDKSVKNEIKLIVSIHESGLLPQAHSTLSDTALKKLYEDLFAKIRHVSPKHLIECMLAWLDALGVSYDPSIVWCFDPTHVHQYKEYKVDPTCQSKGYTRHRCDCGYEYIDNYVNAIDCQFQVYDKTAPTCCTAGAQKSRCVLCGKEKDEVLPQLPHEWTPWNEQIHPTCTTAGKKSRWCSDCKQIQTESIPPLRHNLGDFYDKGKSRMTKYRDCKNCGKSFRVCNPKILNTIQTIAYLSPLILSVIFGCVLFYYDDLIRCISNFALWVFVWIVFVIISIVGTYHSFLEEPKHPFTTVMITLLVVCSVVASALSYKMSNFNPATFITAQVTAKETSWDAHYNYTTLTFSIENTGDIPVTNINGEMVLYDDDKLIGSWTVSFSGDYQPGESYNTTVRFSEEDRPLLYDTPLYFLRVTYQITSMKFNNSQNEYKFDGDVIVLK